MIEPSSARVRRRRSGVLCSSVAGSAAGLGSSLVALQRIYRLRRVTLPRGPGAVPIDEDALGSGLPVRVTTRAGKEKENVREGGTRQSVVGPACQPNAGEF